MKKFYGTGTYVQSVGVLDDLEIDGLQSQPVRKSVSNYPATVRAVLMKWNNGGMICLHSI